MDTLRRVRRVVLGALEVERREKRIGSALEAAPEIWIEDPDVLGVVGLAQIDNKDVMPELCITSDAVVMQGAAPAGAFQLPDTPGVAVVVKRAEGRKCARSWRILPEVGQDPRYPELSLRDADAVAYWDATHGR
jgi:isoleucyl-tRNA synthetase